MEELTAIKTADGREFKPWASKETVQEVVLEAVQDPASITAISSEIAAGKAAIASAIVAKGGSASATDSFSELAQNVEEIPNFSDMARLAGIIAGGNYDKNILQGHNENVKYGKTEIVDILYDFETINVTYCFQYWDLLLKVKLPNVTSIGSYAFRGCTALQEVNIPLLTSIGNAAFHSCTALQEVNFPLLTSFGSSPFQKCTALQEVNFPLLTYIGNYAFQGCTALQEVNIPLLTSIGNAAFHSCTALQEVNFPLLTSIDNYAFQGCTALQEVNFPLLTSIIGEMHFSECTSLQDVTIIGFTTMSRGMFMGCSSLRSVILPTVTTNAQTSTGVPFYQCYNLRNIELGTLVNFSTPFSSNQANLRNITIGADTNINLPFQQWTATNVIAEGGGIDELNTNLYNNLLTKLYDHSNDGQTRTLRIGWLANVSAENIAYANAKGWTLTT